MARTYSELVDLVRRWSNRDIQVLPNNIIADCLRYAADKAYRTLRVPPLEATVMFNSTMLEANTDASNNRFASVTRIQIPSDLIEFIHIRGVDSENRTTRMFNEKADIRTFRDIYAEKYNDNAFWARQGDNILLSPGFGNAGNFYGSSGVLEESGVELYYYRRLPSLHARYDVTEANMAFDNTLTTIQPTALADTPETIPTGAIDGTTYYGLPVPNWLRDGNERIILMGALAEVFFYLQENDEATKYAQLFVQEIEELNAEDKMRTASGGNIQVNFNGRGLI